ncbi:MAG: diaminopimelate epimerase [Parasphingorhabdus sp.]|uniref:diaminopimelate epimerase n=1 Tax=Parasphingorhabdus sp. TaxID=2709688 RepID=UPI003297D9F5
MTKGQFHKMHGLGNDFVIVDARAYDIAQTLKMPPEKAAAIANRHSGIGCDQLIILTRSDRADARMQIFNADGGEVEACGNATRCVVKLLGDGTIIETDGGILSGNVTDNGAVVDMGKPRFDWQSIPLAYAMDSNHMPVGWEDLTDPAAVNIGNPHVIFFVSDNNKIPLNRLGPIIETDPLFPDRVNVNIAHITGNDIHLRVWERGVGLTRACGTGACATAVAAIKRGLVQSPVQVHLPGGILIISWQDDQTIQMQGPTTYVYSGETDWDNFG